MPASTSTPSRQVLQRRDRLAEAAVQARRFGAPQPPSRPAAAAPRCCRSSAPRRASARPRRRRGCAAGLAEPVAEQRQRRRRLLRHVHFEDRLRERGRPRAQALEQLHAAERQRERARVAGHVLPGRPRIEQRDLRASGSARAACSASASPTGPAPITAICRLRARKASFIGHTLSRGWKAGTPTYYSPHPEFRGNSSGA